MTPPTPPPTTHDHKPAYDFAESMEARSDWAEPPTDGEPAAYYWGSWALVEAYMAGRAAALAEKKWCLAPYPGDGRLVCVLGEGHEGSHLTNTAASGGWVWR